MKLSQKTISILLVIMLLSAMIPLSSDAAESSDPAVIQRPSMSNVSRYKSFTVRFNDRINAKDISSQNLYVSDIDGVLQKIRVENGADKHSLIIYPPIAGYRPGETYILHLKNIQNGNGKKMRQPVSMEFSVQQYPKLVSKSTLLPQTILLPSQNVIVNQSEKTVIMDHQTFRQHHLHIGSVIVQETSSANPFGFVGKIRQIDSSDSFVTLKTENPRPEEVYETIDLSGPSEILTHGLSITESTLPYTVENYYDPVEKKDLPRLKYSLSQTPRRLASLSNLTSLDGSIYLENPRFEKEIRSSGNMSWEQLDSAQILLSGRLRGEFQLHSSSASNVPERITLRESLGKISIPLGTPGFTAELSFDLDADASVTTPRIADYMIETDVDYRFGFRKDNKRDVTPVQKIDPHLNSDIAHNMPFSSGQGQARLNNRFTVSAKIYFLKENEHHIPELGIAGNGTSVSDLDLSSKVESAQSTHSLRIRTALSADIRAVGKSVRDFFKTDPQILSLSDAPVSDFAQTLTHTLDKIAFAKEYEHIKKGERPALECVAFYTQESETEKNGMRENPTKTTFTRTIPIGQIDYIVTPSTLASVDAKGVLTLHGPEYQPFTVTARAYGKSCEMTINRRPSVPETTGTFVFDPTTGTIQKYLGSDPDVRIPKKLSDVFVTRIGENAFKEKDLTSVTIPDTVNVIEKGAFAYNHLRFVTLPKTLSEIGNEAFANNQLESIFLPDRLTAIGERAFSENLLVAITIPKSVTSVGAGAFSSNRIIDIDFSPSLTSIAAHTFENNKLSSVTIPNRIRSIDEFAFAQNEIDDLQFPEASLERIGANAFSNNYLQDLTLPNSVHTIESWAFAYNEIKHLILPSKIRHLRANAFRHNKLDLVILPSSAVGDAATAFDENVQIVNKP